MESLRASKEAVTEAAIFSALAPPTYTPYRRPEFPRLRSGGVALPFVNKQTGDGSWRDATKEALTSAMLPPKTPRTLLASVPITSSECTTVWRFLCDWITSQLAMEAPAGIPGFGVFSQQTLATQQRVTVFEPDRTFIDKFALQTTGSSRYSGFVKMPSLCQNKALTEAPLSRSSRAANAAAPHLQQMFSYMEMAACCSSSAGTLDTGKAQEWLQAVIQKIGEAMNQCHQVELDVGVGFLICTDGSVEPQLLSRQTRGVGSKTSIHPVLEKIPNDPPVKQEGLAKMIRQIPKTSMLLSPELSPAMTFDPPDDAASVDCCCSFPPPRRPSPRMFQGIGTRRTVSARESRMISPQQPNEVSPPSQTDARSSKLSTDPGKVEDPLTEVCATLTDGSIPISDFRDNAVVELELFDPLSRTLCVEPDLNLCLLSPSNRIGSNFSDSAKRLVAENISGDNRGDSSKLGVAFLPPKMFPPAQNVNSRGKKISPEASETKYFECLHSKTFIDLKYITPLSPAIKCRIETAALKYVGSMNLSPRLQSILTEEQDAMATNYYSSLKKAILDYLLLRRQTQIRLGIPSGVPPHSMLPSRWKWGDSCSFNGCVSALRYLAVSDGVYYTKGKRLLSKIRGSGMTTQHDRLSHRRTLKRNKIKARLSSLLVIDDPRIRAVQERWCKLEPSLSLIACPDFDQIAEISVPLRVTAFVEKQLDHSQKVKNLLIGNWHDWARMLFFGDGDQKLHSNTVQFGRNKRIMNAVATVMSLQLRGLIFKSIQQYLEFFEQFSCGHNPKLIHCGILSSFMLRTSEDQCREAKIVLVDPLEQVPSHLLRVLHNILEIFQDLPRIDADESNKSLLWNVTTREDSILAATIRIRQIVEQNSELVLHLQNHYQTIARQFHQISRSRIEIDSTLTGSTRDFRPSQLDNFITVFRRIQDSAGLLNTEVAIIKPMNLFAIDCQQLVADLRLLFVSWLNTSLSAFQQKTFDITAELTRSYKEIAVRLARKPSNLDELLDSEAFINSLRKKVLIELQDRAEKVKDRVRFLLFERGTTEAKSIVTSNTGKFPWFSISPDLLRLTAKAFRWHARILSLVSDSDTSLLGERSRIEANFISKRTLLLAEIDEFYGDVRGLAKRSDLRHAATNVVQLGKMKEILASFRKHAESINVDEARLQWPSTDFGVLDDIAIAIEPYEQLWRTARDFREMTSSWFRTNIFEIQGVEGLSILIHMLALITNVTRRLQQSGAGAAMTAELLRKQMTDFRENIRLVLAISHHAMKERHLKQVAALLCMTDLETRDPVTLLKLLENGAYEHVNEVVSISESAAQELSVELAISEIETAWASVRVVFKRTHRGTEDNVGTDQQKFEPTQRIPARCTLALDKRSLEDVISLSEEQEMRLQALSNIPCAEPFAAKIDAWIRFCQRVRLLVSVMVNNERSWRFLFPVLSSRLFFNATAASTKSSDEVLEAFRDARSKYEAIMNHIENHPFFRDLVTSSPDSGNFDPTRTSSLSSDSIVDHMLHCQLLFDRIRDSIRVGVESTRASFSRFRFLTDADLVTVHTCFRDAPWTTSPVFWKVISRSCFPGVSGVVVNQSGDITTLLSAVGEHFPLGAPISTADSTIAACLTKMEKAMMTILQASIRAALGDMARKEFRKWCLLWPEQVLQTVVLLWWTSEGEQANLCTQDKISKWSTLAKDLIAKQDSVSRELKAATHARYRASLSNVISLLAQLRDVSHLLLTELPLKEKQKCQSLAWLAHPRFSFEENALTLRIMTSSALKYGFEYIGNVTNAVIVTPLTLRCYHAIAQTASLACRKGVLLCGPAGSGKTTTSMGLSRLCGRLFVNFEASPKATGVFSLAGNFVCGSAMTGAWLSLHHLFTFNSSFILPLVTLCSQVHDTLSAGETQCVMSGQKLRLRKGTFFLSTLHTSWAMPAAPPPEARFFFRQITVPKINVQVIAEAMFTQRGFSAAKPLSSILFAALSTFIQSISALGNLSTSEMYENISVMTGSVTRFQTIRQIVNMSDELMRAYAVPTSNDLEYRCTFQAIQKTLIAMMPQYSKSIADQLLSNIFSALTFGKLDSSVDLQPSNTNCISTSSNGEPHRSSSFEPNEPHRRWRQNEEIELDCWVRKHCDIEIALFGEEFVSKVIQLKQAVQHHRVVVVVGDAGSGKSSLSRCLALALESTNDTSYEAISDPADIQINEVPREVVADASSQSKSSKIRQVTLCAQALPLPMLLGLETTSSDFGDTVLGKITRDAKSHLMMNNRSQTWVILDGEIDMSWSDYLIDIAGDCDRRAFGKAELPAGMMVPGGKFVTLAQNMRLMFETTSLENASPSFISRSSFINLGAAPVLRDWRPLFRVWKATHYEEFAVIGEALYRILDVSLNETLDASIEFIEQNFSLTSASRRVQRVQSLFAHLHSAFSAALEGLVGMVSTKQRDMAICCFYLQALVWSIGNTSDRAERQSFHAFLRHLIINGPENSKSTLKRALLLFFPSSGDAVLVRSGTASRQLSSSKGGASVASGGASSAQIDTIYGYAFSIEFGLKWMRWSEYYDTWLQRLGGSTQKEVSEMRSPLFFTHVSVPIPNLVAPTCMMYQLLVANYSPVLIGPSDCGKTMAMERLWSIMQSDDKDQSHLGIDQSDSGSLKRRDTDSEGIAFRVFSSMNSTASGLLEQLQPLLKRIQSVSRVGKSNPNVRPPVKHLKAHQGVIFIDDLHYLDSHSLRTSDRAEEVIRMIVDHRCVVHPERKVLMNSDKILLCGTMQERRLTVSTAFHRLVQKCVPVLVSTLNDSDLISICSVLASLTPVVSVPHGADENATTDLSTKPLSIVSESAQLETIVIKASLKLFRSLTNYETVFSKSTCIVPNKLLYNFRIVDLFRVVWCTNLGLKPSSSISEKSSLARMWCHESARTFGDRIIDERECSKFYQQLQATALSSFGITPDTLFPSHMDASVLKNASRTQDWLSKQLTFTFVGENNGAGYIEGYREVTDLQKVELSIERSMMAMYQRNDSDTGTPEVLELLLCQYVVHHVLRLCRLLRVVEAPLVLLGRRGCKLVTILRLAAFISKLPICILEGTSIEPDKHTLHKNWKSQLKEAMKAALHTDSSNLLVIIKYDAERESCEPLLELLNQFFAGYDLPPDFITHEDLTNEDVALLRDRHRQYIAQLSAQHQPPETSDPLGVSSVYLQSATAELDSNIGMLAFFFKETRKKINIAIATRPNHSVANLVWRYPHLVKTSSINYLEDWPVDSLVTVAQKCFLLSPTIDKERASQLSSAVVGLYISTKNFLKTFNNSGDHEVSAFSRGINEEVGSVKASDTLYFTSSNQPSTFIDVTPALLIDHVGLILSHWEGLELEIKGWREKYESGLVFLNGAEQILLAEQSHAEQLKPEMQHKLEVRRRMSGNLEREKITTSKITRGLEVATDLVELRRERVAAIEEEYMGLIHNAMTSFQRTQQELIRYVEAVNWVVEEAQSEEERIPLVQQCDTQKIFSEVLEAISLPNEIPSIDQASGQECDSSTVDSSEKAASFTYESSEESISSELRRLRFQIKRFAATTPIPTSLLQLAECIGLIMDIAPVETHDDIDPEEVVMDYWNSLAACLETPEFWTQLMTFDATKRFDEKVVALLLPICTAPDFEVDMFKSVHEVAGVLCEWVQTYATFARDLVLARPKLIQLEHEREAFIDAQNQVEARTKELRDQVDTTLTQVSAQRLTSELERQNVEEKLRDNESTLELTSAVWKALYSSRIKWKQQYEHYTQLSTKWLGDLLMATATIAYASSLSTEARSELCGPQWWSTILAQHFISHSSSRSLHQIMLMSNLEISRLQPGGLHGDLDESTRDKIVIAISSFRIPLLLDPHGIAMKWMQQYYQCEGSGLCVLSATLSTATEVWKAICDSILTNSVLLITDFNRDIAQKLAPFIAAKSRGLFRTMNQDVVGSGGRSDTFFVTDKSGAQRRGKQRHQCWCSPSDIGFTTEMPGVCQNGEVKVSTYHLFEFLSCNCRVFFIYSLSAAIADWMAIYQSQLCIIPFELTSAFIEQTCWQTILEAGGRSQALTELQALRRDILVAEEQASIIENDLLYFLSTTSADEVCIDAPKSLKVVENRAAFNIQEKRRAESEAKMQHHFCQLEPFCTLVERCIDIAQAWRDMRIWMHHATNYPRCWEDVTLSVEWVWRSLIRALEIGGIGHNSGLITSIFTSDARGFAYHFFRDEDRIVFDFILAFYLYQRRATARIRDEESNADSSRKGRFQLRAVGTLVRSSNLTHGLLLRLLAAVACTESVVSAKLANTKYLKHRPDDVSKRQWKILCFIAEESPSLQHFIAHNFCSRSTGNERSSLYHVVSSINNKMSASSRDCAPGYEGPDDPLLRLCIRVALDETSFVTELERFIVLHLDENPTSQYVSDENETSGATELETMEVSLPRTSLIPRQINYIRAKREGVDALTHILHTYTNSDAPIVVIASAPQIDVVALVSEAANKARTVIDGGSIDLMALNHWGKLKKQVLMAANKGLWVVLRHLPSVHGPMFLPQLHQVLKGQRFHPDFRLWVALIENSAICSSATRPQTTDESNYVSGYNSNLIGAYVTLGSSHFSLKHILEHAIRVILSTIGKDADSLPEKSQRLLVRVGVFHAVISSKNGFPFGMWNQDHDTYSDSDLIEVVQTVIPTLQLQTLEPKSITLESNPEVASTNAACLCNLGRLKSIIQNVYAVKLSDEFSRNLIEACFQVVFSSTMTSEKKYINAPQVSKTLQVVHVFDEANVSDALQLLEHWPAEYETVQGLGFYDLETHVHPKLAKDIAQIVMESTHSELALVRCSKLKALFNFDFVEENKSFPDLLESLAALKADITDLVTPREFQKEMVSVSNPLQTLMQNEFSLLQRTAQKILHDISTVHRVAMRFQPLDPESQSLVKELMSSGAPRNWRKSLFPSISSPPKVKLKTLHTHLVERVQSISRWLDAHPPVAIPLNHFSNIESVLNAVHLHLSRIAVSYCGNGSKCLRVYKLHRETEELALISTPTCVYIGGVVAEGTLQLEASQQTTRPITKQEDQSKASNQVGTKLSQDVRVVSHGVPVILEVRATCKLSQDEPGACCNSLVVGNSSESHHCTFQCPIYRSFVASDNLHPPEASISILTETSTDQLILAGARLRVKSPSF